MVDLAWLYMNATDRRGTILVLMLRHHYLKHRSVLAELLEAASTSWVASTQYLWEPHPDTVVLRIDAQSRLKAAPAAGAFQS